MQFYTVSIGTYTPVGVAISDFRFLLRCEGDLLPSGLLLCLDWYLFTDVSAPICCPEKLANIDVGRVIHTYLHTYIS